jgi:hypothetical protein
MSVLRVKCACGGYIVVMPAYEGKEIFVQNGVCSECYKVTPLPHQKFNEFIHSDSCRQ